jgi:hypothetical protein
MPGAQWDPRCAVRSPDVARDIRGRCPGLRKRNPRYVNLTDRSIKDSEEVADGIVVDYDAGGRIER